ncbi:MAG: hypothetical protein K6U03_11285, partial [Firmicutes bacterium]|nr:hypothetical protein [Bacillota bacterium]
MKRRSGAEIWRHLVLLYLGLFLFMGSWGVAGTMLGRWSRPAAAISPSPRPGPSLAEMLGLWPPGRLGWRRILEIGIPGLAAAGRRLTLLPIP